MAIRGIDTQMLATKPADLTAGQHRAQKQAEVHMQHTAQNIHKSAEQQAQRTVAASKAEGRRIGDEDEERRRKRGGEQGGQTEGEQEEQTARPPDPMLSLPVDRGKYARRAQHFIDVKL